MANATTSVRQSERSHYFPVPDWVFRLRIPAGPWRTYCSIAMHANDLGSATLKRSTIAAECDCTVRTVARHLLILEQRYRVLSVECQHRADGSLASSIYTLRNTPDSDNIDHRRAAALRGGPRDIRVTTPRDICVHPLGTRVSHQELPSSDNYLKDGTTRARGCAREVGPVRVWTAVEDLGTRFSEWTR